ncbi:MAG TPA: nuclear transport factor 2 family protein [Pyrinomonadaceae bacterium]|nr:nuclear transport factor 2 family protein [Pyrinomonadaceae bacterium]
MKQTAFRLAVAVVTFVTGLGLAALVNVNPFRGSAVAPSAADEQEVLRVEREYIRANLDADTDTLREILADEFSIRTRWGRVTTRAERLARLDNYGLAFQSFRTHDVRVVVTGDTAVVSGTAFLKARDEEDWEPGRTYRFSRDYEKRDGRWQIVTVYVRP